MKHFVYTFKEGRAPRDGSGIVKTVRVYRIVKNRPVFISECSDTFVSEFQLVLMAMVKTKEFPRKIYARHPNGSPTLCNAWQFEKAGIATFNRID